ncbi:hypothetical protein GCM10007275_13800 [Jeotgalicoccus coquinae]|uniref:Membrane protein YkoI n=1 Tax=Jeotgalicoccus coquinae TaxID=709509 RepID=A0A6V7R3N6_9STAP|nr:PepSY domain-containing protein [Jeotgalicoccus coquinae]MBB6423456.1 putative membrane protein YkoI [Jeotgalicoccus coquinae]GGE20019.1 hypothetical protein GCM10007275_13800 [Jeotgalicoccus coquinae]CAD2071684.1 hypothetical protein JEOCOQ751_00352 [Jeotgalicoccus coquinae]
MAKRSKFLIALAGLIAGIVIGVLWVSLNQQDFISEDEARAVVTERYGGSVESVSLSDDDRYFVINLKGKSATHSVTVDREDSSVQGIKTVAEHKEPAEENKEKKQDKKDKEKAQTEQEKKDKENSEEQPAENTKLTVEDAVEIAAAEVGGTNVYSTWSGEGSAREYYILQLVDDDDEGALIAINGITGNVNKVIWLEIDDDYSGIEQLVYEASEYANMHEGRYIEYDDDYFED